MNDQRVVSRATLRGKNLGHRSIVIGVGCKAVDRFSWQANEAAISYTVNAGSY